MPILTPASFTLPALPPDLLNRLSIQITGWEKRFYYLIWQGGDGWFSLWDLLNGNPAPPAYTTLVNPINYKGHVLRGIQEAARKWMSVFVFNAVRQILTPAGGINMAVIGGSHAHISYSIHLEGFREGQVYRDYVLANASLYSPVGGGLCEPPEELIPLLI